MTPLGPKTLIAAAVSALLLSGCSANTDSTELEGGEKVVASGKLTVCTHLPYKPFEFNQGDKVVGMDIDLMDLVAEELGLEVSVVNTPFEGIESGQSMNTGKCDIAAAGMTITDERSRVMDFTDPYFDATQALLVKKGSGITSLDDLSGEVIGAQIGTTGLDYTEENAPEGAEVKRFEDLALLTAAVKTGSIPAGVNDNSVLYDYVASNPDTEVVAEFDTGEQYGFAVAKDQNDALLETVNEVLAKAKDDGTYDKIYDQWFPTAPKG